MLNEETVKIDLENHYWLKDNFLDKIGRMAPNLVHISLRKLQISDHAFFNIIKYLNHVQQADFSNCKLIQPDSLI